MPGRRVRVHPCGVLPAWAWSRPPGGAGGRPGSPMRVRRPCAPPSCSSNIGCFVGCAPGRSSAGIGWPCTIPRTGTTTSSPPSPARALADAPYRRPTLFGRPRRSATPPAPGRPLAARWLLVEATRHARRHGRGRRLGPIRSQRNSAMTAAWTATVAPRSGSWEATAADVVAGPPRRADRPARLRAVRDSHTALIHQVKPLATRRLHARPRA
jgi:hypothetical protein